MNRVSARPCQCPFHVKTSTDPRFIETRLEIVDSSGDGDRSVAIYGQQNFLNSEFCRWWIAFSLLLFSAWSSSAQTVYVNTSSGWGYLDMGTLSSTRLTSSFPEGLGNTTHNDVIYAKNGQGLHMVSPQTGTSIGQVGLGLADVIGTLGSDGVDLYSLENVAGESVANLYRVNSSNSTRTLIGSTNLLSSGDAYSMAYQNGKFYTATKNGIYSIDRLTGAATFEMTDGVSSFGDDPLIFSSGGSLHVLQGSGLYNLINLSSIDIDNRSIFFDHSFAGDSGYLGGRDQSRNLLGVAVGPNIPASVPEPGMLALLALGALSSVGFFRPLSRKGARS